MADALPPVSNPPVALAELVFVDPVDDEHVSIQMHVPPHTLMFLVKRDMVPVIVGRFVRAYGVGGQGKLNLV
jgi:hypothetical protein